MSSERSIDACAPFVVYAAAGACGHGIWVDTRFDAHEDRDANERAVTLALRSVERADDHSVYAHGDPVLATLSLDTGRCVALDQDAALILEKHPWFESALATQMDLLHSRAARS